MRQEIRELQQSLELTVIYVTHDQEEALAVSDNIIVMDGGRIAQQGSPDVALRAAGEPLPGRLHRRCEPRRRRVDATSAEGPRFAAGNVSVPVRADGMSPGAGDAGRAAEPAARHAAGEGLLPGN